MSSSYDYLKVADERMKELAVAQDPLIAVHVQTEALHALMMGVIVELREIKEAIHAQRT